MFVFGTDLIDEGYTTVLHNLKDRAGVDAVSLSATYHNARDIFPHNPRSHVYKHEGDVAWFQPQRDNFRSGLVPTTAQESKSEDVLARLCVEAERLGMPVNAWTIFLHNSRLGREHPDCTTRNIYGDAYVTDLCPANPRVQDYARELCEDITRYPVASILAESLHYRPFEHGLHHERYLLDIPLTMRSYLSLCFCKYCTAAASNSGVDVERLGTELRTQLDQLWLDEPSQTGTSPLPLGNELQAELDAYLDVRERTVTNLISDARGVAAAHGVEFTFIDHGGAMPHVMRGTTADDSITVLSRKLGVNVREAASVSDELSILGYVDTPERLEKKITAYRDTVSPVTPFSVVLRPLIPDSEDADNFSAKVRVVKKSGAVALHIYHYALMPLRRLDWIRTALTQDAGPQS